MNLTLGDSTAIWYFRLAGAGLLEDPHSTRTRGLTASSVSEKLLDNIDLRWLDISDGKLTSAGIYYIPDDLRCVMFRSDNDPTLCRVLAQYKAEHAKGGSPYARGYSFARPLEAYINRASQRQWCKMLNPHIISSPLPTAAICRVDTNLMIMSSELLTTYVSRVLEKAHLVALWCYEIAGYYTLLPKNYVSCAKQSGILYGSMFAPSLDELRLASGYVERKPLTKVATIQSLLGKLGRLKGLKGAVAGAKLALDDANSPQEARVALQLYMPRRIGGKGAGKPILNKAIPTTPEAYEICKCKTLIPDALFVGPSKQKVDVETQGLYHDNPDQMRKDNLRREALESMGIRVMYVSRSTFRDIDRWDDFTNEVLAQLGYGLQPLTRGERYAFECVHEDLCNYDIEREL